MKKEYKIGIVSMLVFLLTFFYKSISLDPKIYAVIVCVGLSYIILELVKEKKIVLFLIALIIIFLVGILFFNIPMRWS